MIAQPNDLGPIPANREMIHSASNAALRVSAIVSAPAAPDANADFGFSGYYVCSIMSRIENHPRRPRSQFAASSAPRANTDRSRTSCVNVTLSEGPSNPT